MPDPVTLATRRVSGHRSPTSARISSSSFQIVLQDVVDSSVLCGRETCSLRIAEACENASASRGRGGLFAGTSSPNGPAGGWAGEARRGRA
eukprot:5187182-Pyramimonas_sp.AAC.1